MWRCEQVKESSHLGPAIFSRKHSRRTKLNTDCSANTTAPGTGTRDRKHSVRRVAVFGDFGSQSGISVAGVAFLRLSRSDGNKQAVERTLNFGDGRRGAAEGSKREFRRN